VAGRVFKISGTVEITEGRRVRREKFVDGIATGPEDAKIRESFRYYRTFCRKQQDKERSKYRELHEAGCIRIVEYQLHGECGLAGRNT